MFDSLDRELFKNWIIMGKSGYEGKRHPMMRARNTIVNSDLLSSCLSSLVFRLIDGSDETCFHLDAFDQENSISTLACSWLTLSQNH